jgi:hypothetical protein
VNVDFTFIDRLFVGVGGGAGLIGAVGVPQVQLRVGGYPVMVHGHGARRKALMVGGDFSLHIISGVVLMQPMFNIGYEAF